MDGLTQPRIDARRKARQGALGDLRKLRRLNVTVLLAQNLAVGVREHEGRIGVDAERLGDAGVFLAVEAEGDEMVAQQFDDGRVAEGRRFELTAPVAILRTEVDDERQILIVGLTAGGAVIY